MLEIRNDEGRVSRGRSLVTRAPLNTSSQEQTEETEFSPKKSSVLSPFQPEADPSFGGTSCKKIRNPNPVPLLLISYLLCGITCVNPAMETDGLSNLPSERLGNGGDGVNLKGSGPPGGMSPDTV